MEGWTFFSGNLNLLDENGKEFIADCIRTYDGEGGKPLHCLSGFL